VPVNEKSAGKRKGGCKWKKVHEFGNKSDLKRRKFTGKLKKGR
jgi:hypothetical protein